MSLASESELAGLLIAAKDMLPLHETLIEMCWYQPRTPLQTNNLMAAGVTNNTVVPRHTKLMDMRFYWLRCN